MLSKFAFNFNLRRYAMAGVTYCRTRNLAASMLVHASFNLGVLVLFSLWTNS
jgi:membrane protease YdiL (CAAX protease family)